MFKLRRYQEEGVEACVKVMTAPKKKGIVVAPTGAGKSLYISKTIEKLDVPVVILQPSKELLKQNYLKYIKSGGKASIYCASLKTKTKNKKNYTVVEGKEVRCDEISKVTYATIGSVIKDINKLKKIGVKHIIVDEVHLQSKVGSQMRTFIKALGATNVLGLTATPIYLQGGMEGSRLIMINRSFGTMFRDIVHVTQIKELVDTGFWTPLRYKIIKTDESSLSLNTSGSDYTEHSQREYYKSNNLKEQIVEEVNRLKKEGRKKILVFVPSILEAEQLYGLIPNSAVVHSKLSTKERDFMVDSFTNGDIPVVLNCLDLETEILTESGWVKHNEMTFNHRVANWDNGKVYFDNPLDIINKEISKEENMISYESNSVNFRVTGGHDMLVKKYKYENYIKEQAKELCNRKLFVPINGNVTDIDFQIEQEVPKSNYNRRWSANTYNIKKSNSLLSHEECRIEAKKRLDERLSLKYKNPSELSLEECELMGMFFGDGCLSGNRYTIVQSMTYPVIVERIDEILSIIGYSFSRIRQKKCSKCNNESIKWTLNTGRGFGTQKCDGFYPILPYLNKDLKYLEYLNREQIKSFLKGLWLADGNHLEGTRTIKRGFAIHNSNKKALDKIQSVCVTRGIKCSIVSSGKPRFENHNEVFNLRFDTDVTESLINNRIKVRVEEYKKERVWCVKTKSGNIITRRKGKVVVLGNCNILSTGYDNPEIDAIITSRPTSSIAIFYQQIGRGCRLHEDKKDCVIVDFSGNTNRFGRVENIEFCDIPNYGWGMFGEGGKLLSDYPIMQKIRPTKESLAQDFKRKEEVKLDWVKEQTVEPSKLSFGKHKGKTVETVYKEDKNYLMWIVEMYSKGEWTFYGETGKKLKKEIFEKLALPV